MPDVSSISTVIKSPSVTVTVALAVAGLLVLVALVAITVPFCLILIERLLPPKAPMVHAMEQATVAPLLPPWTTSADELTEDPG